MPAGATIIPEGFTTEQRKGAARWGSRAAGAAPQTGGATGCPTPSRVTIANCFPEALRSGHATAAAYASSGARQTKKTPILGKKASSPIAIERSAQVIRGQCSAEDINRMSSEKFGRLLQQEISQIETDEIAKMERIFEAEHNVIKCLTIGDDYDNDDECNHNHDHNHDNAALIAMDVKEMDIEVAIESGSVVNVAIQDIS